MQKLLIIILAISSNYVIGMNPQIVAQAVAAAQLVLAQKEKTKEKKRKADQEAEDSRSKKLKATPKATGVTSADSVGKGKFKCDTCGKFFVTQVVLNRHKRIHTGEKPFKCDICNYAATQKSFLVDHVRIHTGEQPFACDICGSLFRQKSNMVTHKKRYHANGKSSKKIITSADGKYAITDEDSNKIKQETVLEPLQNNGLFTVSDDEEIDQLKSDAEKKPLGNIFTEVTIEQYPQLAKMLQENNILGTYKELKILQKITFQANLIDIFGKALMRNSLELNLALIKEIDCFINEHSAEFGTLAKSQIQKKLNKIKLQFCPIK